MKLHPIKWLNDSMELIPLVNIQDEVSNLFDQLGNDVSQLFRKGPFLDMLGKSEYPKVNFKKEKTDLVIEAAIPFFDPKDVSITIDKNILTLSAKSVNKNEEYLSKEISQRSFVRSWQFQKDLSEDMISASYNKGVLYVKITGMFPEPPPPPKKITISVNN